MATLKQLQFRTSALTGTGSRKKAGESLANILIGSARLASAITSGQKAEEAREERKLSAEETRINNVRYLTDLSELEQKYQEDKANGKLKTSQQLEDWVNANDKNADGNYWAEDSMHGAKYRKHLTSVYGNKVMGMRVEENDALGNQVIEAGTLGMTLGDYGDLKELSDLTEAGNEVTSTGGLKFKDTLKKVLVDSSIKMKQELATGELDGMSKDEILNWFGGNAFSEIEDKKSKEYIEFEQTLDKVSKEVEIRFHKKNVLDGIFNEQNASTVSMYAEQNNIDHKDVMKSVNNSVNQLMLAGDMNKAIRVSNLWKSNGESIEILDNHVNNMFVSGQPSETAYKTWVATKDEYPYTKEVNDNMRLFKAVGEVNKLDLSTQDDINSALLFVQDAKSNGKLNKEQMSDIDEEINYKSLIGSRYNNSQKSFLNDKLKLYMKANLTLDQAIELAEEEYEQYGKITNSDEPNGMWADSEEQSNIFIRSRSQTNSTDDVDMEYLGNDKWVIRAEGKQTIALTNKQIKAEMNKQVKIDKTVKDLTMTISGEKLTGEDAEIRKMIKKRASAEIKRLHPDLKADGVKRLSDVVIRDGLIAIRMAEAEANSLSNLNIEGTNLQRTTDVFREPVVNMITDAIEGLPPVVESGMAGLKEQLRKTISVLGNFSDAVVDSMISEAYKNKKK